MNKKIFTAAIFLLGLSTAIFAQTADIYMAGWENGKVTVWKNGVATYLTSPSEDDNWACGVYASGNDVYVAGTESGRVVIWKNGVANYLTDGSKYAEIFSMSVSNGNICVAGYEEDYTSYYSNAKLWKNSESIDLITGSSIHSEALSVFASGDDVYVAGYDQPEDIDAFPKLWKNGTAIDFAADLKNNYASAVFVSGNDVYVALEDHRYSEDGQVTRIKLWKNGEVIDFAEVSGYSQISSMFVSGNDVYVGGDGFFKLWKNGEVIDMENISSNATVRSIYVSGNDVYAAIQEYAAGNVNGYYWKNGEKTLFSTNGLATSIFIASPNANIPEIKSADIKVYPNPTKDKVYIEIESNIKLYNMHGMLLQETFGKEIDLSGYPQGIYFLQVEGKMIKVVKR